ncbi:Glutathione-dependent formaldehyde-activating enzyme [Acinetobacter calcoaceticus]|uniref:Glutathione-dependent formaldehyde-activating enzyme n=1 Tax=Acinetobacter calcoaceticus TaxID=471 RepID=A0A446ZLB5_ACICA|nr:GFA family protein [Acinetobacter calcoaceticus]VAX45286.1 Glutathione-dependent formaldehyde-activating enzyme [Acinetobacter calcoaceticus]
MAYTASCLCNGIQLQIDAELAPIMVCHCNQCQKAQGAAFAVITQVQKSDLNILQGENLLQAYFSSPNKKRMFCKTCGSPVWSERLDKPEVVRLRVGLVNEEISTQVSSHAFVTSKVKWYSICDDAHQYPNGVESP